MGPSKAPAADQHEERHRDTFTAFVDALADVLDDHDTTAGELAGRLCMSRFHLDRIVSRVAGEPPHRFRRRILLERAAYRLVSTDRSILDIAVEAGYGSPRGVHPCVRGGVRRTAG